MESGGKLDRHRVDSFGIQFSNIEGLYGSKSFVRGGFIEIDVVHGYTSVPEAYTGLAFRSTGGNSPAKTVGSQHTVRRFHVGGAMQKPSLVVLAAGMGSRYGGVKQIDPVGVGDEAIIDFSVYDAITVGFDHVIFVIRREIEDDVREFFAGTFESKIRVSYVFQDLDDIPEGYQVPADRAKPWGTAHAMLAARHVVDSPYAVINADDFYGRPALSTMARYLSAIDPDSTDYAMVGYRLDRTLSPHGTVSRGIVKTDNDGWLVSIEEHTKLRPQGDEVLSLNDDSSVRARFSGTEATSMNLFGFTPRAMEQFSEEFADFLSVSGDDTKAEFYIPYAMNRLKEQNRARMTVLRSDSEWFGVTYRDDRPAVVSRLRDLVEDGIYPPSLWG